MLKCFNFAYCHCDDYFICRLEAIACDAELQEKPLADIKRLGELLKKGCEDAMNDYRLKLEGSQNAEDSNLSGNSDSTSSEILCVPFANSF